MRQPQTPTGSRLRYRLPRRMIRAYHPFLLLGLPCHRGRPVGRHRRALARREQRQGHGRRPRARSRTSGRAGGTCRGTPSGPAQLRPAPIAHRRERVALALTAALSIVLGWLVAGRFLAPLRAITATTREISAANLHERLSITGPDDEIKKLGDTFDDLLGRLERSFDFERQFVANASHELRTPLATMRASLDVAMAKPGPLPAQVTVLAERLRRELDHVDLLLESLLSLARAQRGPVGDEATVSLDAAVASAIERRSGAISYMGLVVSQELCTRAWARGSSTLLERMVDNLVDNAVKHNEQGGLATCETSVGRARRAPGGGEWRARPHPDDVDELARPFKRLGAERTGSERGNGLGLSIVQAIAEAHDGVLDLHARSGGGLRVVVTLPRARGQTVEHRQ